MGETVWKVVRSIRDGAFTAPRYGSTALRLQLLGHVNSVRCGFANGPQTYMAVAARPQPLGKCGTLASAQVAGKGTVSHLRLREGEGTSKLGRSIERRILSPITARPRTPPGVGTPRRASDSSGPPASEGSQRCSLGQSATLLRCEPRDCSSIVIFLNRPTLTRGSRRNHERLTRPSPHT